MIIYLKLGRYRGISIEINKDFCLKPFFQKKGFHHEEIIDIPYAQIIYTSGQWRPKKRVRTNKSVKYSSLTDKTPIKAKPIRNASNVNEETNQTTKRTG